LSLNDVLIIHLNRNDSTTKLNIPTNYHLGSKSYHLSSSIYIEDDKQYTASVKAISDGNFYRCNGENIVLESNAREPEAGNVLIYASYPKKEIVGFYNLGLLNSMLICIDIYNFYFNVRFNV
jgi:hypothetical protein